MVNFVIAKYNENVEWTKKLNHKVTIYDKSDRPVEGSIKLKNKGREGETFLYHIVNNYHNLDDVTVFLQGHPFDHLQVLVGWRCITPDQKEDIDMVINKMNTEINDNSEFTTFYQVLYNVPNGTNSVNTTHFCMKYYNEYHTQFTVSAGAQYIVPKKYILSRPLEFWKQLQSALYNNTELDNGYCQEQLWYLAYTGKLNPTVGDHDQEKAKCTQSHGFNETPYSYFEKHNIRI